MNDYLLSQVFSSVALVLGIAAYQSKQDRKLKLTLSAAATFQAIHFLLLGATQGFVQSLVTAARFFTAAWWQSPQLFWVFVTLGTVVGAWRYASLVDLLPILANFIACVAVFRLKGISTRYGLLATTLCWLMYNALQASVMGCVLEVFYVVTNLMTIRQLQISSAKF